jgi:hypothetical protein
MPPRASAQGWWRKDSATAQAAALSAVEIKRFTQPSRFVGAVMTAVTQTTSVNRLLRPPTHRACRSGAAGGNQARKLSSLRRPFGRRLRQRRTPQPTWG